MSWCRRLLIRLLRSLLYALEPTTDPIHRRAAALVREAEHLKGSASGAYLRWQYVLARLQKEFPGSRTRDLNMAIELAVQRDS